MQPHTQFNSRQAKHAAIYQDLNLQTKLATADPYTLVKILYEELENSLRVLKALDSRKKDLSNNSQGMRAHSILLALLNGLSEKGGTNLSEALAKVYHSMAIQVNLINRSGDASRLDELIEGVVNIRTAWNRIADLH